MERHRRVRWSLCFKEITLTLSLLLCFNVKFCIGRFGHHLPVAGIFGIGGNKDNNNQQQQRRPVPPLHEQRQQSSMIPPPPPGRAQNPTSTAQSRPEVGSGTIPGPPRPIRQTAGLIPRQHNMKEVGPPPKVPPPPPRQITSHGGKVEDPATGNTTAVEDSPNLEIETPPMAEENLSNMLPQQNYYPDNAYQMGPPPQQQMGPPSQQGWLPPAPVHQDVWQQPPQGYYDPAFLEGELDESLAREDNLIMQLDNMTASVSLMEQREELHLRQLDVLTERIMDIEAQAAEERNKLVEYEDNCTAYALTADSLKEKAEEWKKRCSDLTERQENDTATIVDLKRSIKEKQSQAEEIAIAIENIRLAEKRREDSIAKRGSARKSLLSKLFSYWFGTKEDFVEMSREDAYDIAKSTLLRALQSERGSVHELEGVVTSLHQNNSAISEMVESRDSIIDELNNRISVFEEDKVVLKAALRQLQKEIEEEAPKAQKLMGDLATAEADAEHFKNDMNSLIRTHQEELNMLQQTLSTKQKTISESESNLTAIGTYVDKLEDRLTSFAITRRDMEAREKRCKEIEDAASVTESQKKELEEKLATFSQEQEELKKLLKELANERTNLQKDNRKLATDSEFRFAENEQLQSKCTSLDCEVKNLTQALDELRSMSEILVTDLETVEQENSKLKQTIDQSITVKAELGETQSQNTKLQDEVKALRDEKQSLQEDLNSVTQTVQEHNMKMREQDLEVRKQEGRARQEAAAFSPPGVSSHRKVPLRSLRKQLSKVTGIHGVITPSTTMLKDGAQEGEFKVQKARIPSFPTRRSHTKVDLQRLSKEEEMARRPLNQPPPPPSEKKEE